MWLNENEGFGSNIECCWRCSVVEDHRAGKERTQSPSWREKEKNKTLKIKSFSLTQNQFIDPTKQSSSSSFNPVFLRFCAAILIFIWTFTRIFLWRRRRNLGFQSKKRRKSKLRLPPNLPPIRIVSTRYGVCYSCSGNFCCLFIVAAILLEILLP